MILGFQNWRCFREHLYQLCHFRENWSSEVKWHLQGQVAKNQTSRDPTQVFWPQASVSPTEHPLSYCLFLALTIVCSFSFLTSPYGNLGSPEDAALPGIAMTFWHIWLHRHRGDESISLCRQVLLHSNCPLASLLHELILLKLMCQCLY